MKYTVKTNLIFRFKHFKLPIHLASDYTFSVLETFSLDSRNVFRFLKNVDGVIWISPALALLGTVLC